MSFYFLFKHIRHFAAQCASDMRIHFSQDGNVDHPKKLNLTINVSLKRLECSNLSPLRNVTNADVIPQQMHLLFHY